MSTDRHEMIDAAEQVQHLVDCITLSELEPHRQLRDALLWNFTVLGEAASQISISASGRAARGPAAGRTGIRNPAVLSRVSVHRWILPGMPRFEDQDMTDAEFRECDLTRARLIGVVMQDAVIDGLVRNLVVNGVEVTSYVEAELDRRHPVRLLIRSADPADLREASRQLGAGWAAT